MTTRLSDWGTNVVGFTRGNALIKYLDFNYLHCNLNKDEHFPEKWDCEGLIKSQSVFFLYNLYVCGLKFFFFTYHERCDYTAVHLTYMYIKQKYIIEGSEG